MNEIRIGEMSMRQILRILALVILLPIVAINVWTQCPDGRPPPCKGSGSPPPPPPPKRCTNSGTITVKCALAGCQISLDGNNQGITGSTGNLEVPASQGSHTIVISKQGYNDVSRTVKVGCNDTINLSVDMVARVLTLRVKTNPGNCDVYIDQQLRGHSDSDGIFTTSVTEGTYLLEARKEGFLSVSRAQAVTLSDADKEISISLPPASATLILKVDAGQARVTIDDSVESSALTDRIILSPGTHRITVRALGYVSAVLPITIGPGEQLSKTLTLGRLSADDLAKQAEQLFNERSFELTLQLCNYLFEANPDSAIGHKLVGLSLLFGNNKDYGAAGRHLAKAVAGNEIIRLPIRRHTGESFELNGPHNNCGGVLSISRQGVEFGGTQMKAEDFQVKYNQMQILGLQLKKNVALYLATKVTDARGKTHDYNFYSPEGELSQSGRPYLEILLNLLRAN